MQRLKAKEATALIRRLGSLPGYPKDIPEAQAALVEMLSRKAICEEHAHDAISRVLETAQYSPTPAQVAEALSETATPYKPPAARQCEFCIEGWRRVWYLKTHPPAERARYERITAEQVEQLRGRLGPQQEIVEAAKACTCSAGQVRSRRDAA